jgi:S-adenosyl-L-methionine hydrolase (adenosine-forming)
MTRIITLLTDFGTADGYVGEMKGVLVSSAPGCSLIDITHDLTAQDVDGARLTIARYWQRYPMGTVHLAVVDPGVGGARAAIAVHSAGRFLVGPDNGLLSPALLLPDARCVSLPIPHSASATFHGRDVFAPAAAQLVSGAAIDTIGTPFESPVILRTPEATRDANGDVHGVVMTIDRFGNVLTNLVSRRPLSIHVGGRAIPVARTYADVPSGSLVALVGSSGFIEVAERDGRASDVLGVIRGDPVLMRVDH